MNRDKVKQAKAERQRPIIGVSMSLDSCLRSEADARGWRLFSMLHGDHSLLGVKLQGVLSEAYGDPVVQDLQRHGVPAVRMGMLPGPCDKAIPAVIWDMAAEGRMAADHFHVRGFQNVGFIHMEPMGDHRPLFEAFRDGAGEYGMACHSLGMKLLDNSPDRLQRQKEKQRLFADWIKTMPKPIGIITFSDWIAASYCSWVQQAGFTVPDDVAVIAVTRSAELSECTRPTITTVDRSDAERTRRACDVLAGLMSGKKQPERIWVAPTGITERESTNVLATQDRIVAAALRYMWDNLKINMSIADVARVVNLSPRQLERRFQAAIERGVNEELQRRRLQEFCRLLLSTELPVSDIAPMVGFASTSYLHRVFRKVHGATPAKYRRARSKTKS